ncbi:hypothetical protein DAI22_09g045566 [Oryza sativa Japonica Group]|nr:hypothetical protein DAI22_09g045566 [Oryza sativa Japonica Group]
MEEEIVEESLTAVKGLEDIMCVVVLYRIITYKITTHRHRWTRR